MRGKRFLKVLGFLAISLGVTINVYGKELIPSTRICGNNRYETSVNILNAGWSKSETVILVTGENYPDAISAAPLAKKYDAPIILVNKGLLPYELSTEISLLKPKKVYIVGGTSAISQQVELELASGMNVEVERISGKNRYETSVQVAKEIGRSEEVFVATSNSFADALSVSTVASSKKSPIILSDKNFLSKSAKEYIKSNGVLESYVIGGQALLSDNIVKELPSPERIGGSNRYETNYKILNRFKEDINFEKVYVATGKNFPDALSGSALASKKNSPIILTADNPYGSTIKTINENIDNINEAVLLGGKAVIPDKVLEKLNMKEIRYMSDEIDVVKGTYGHGVNCTGYLSMIGNKYLKGYSFVGENGTYSFNLDKKYENISGILGSNFSKSFTAEFLCDGKSKNVYEFKDGDLPKIVDIDVKGVKKLEIKIEVKDELYGSINFANVILNEKGAIKSINPVGREFKTGYMTDVIEPYYVGDWYYADNEEMLYIGDKTYEKGFSFTGNPSKYIFYLNKKYNTIKGVLGSMDTQGFKVELICDGVSKGIYEFKDGHLPKDIEIDVKNVETFEMKILESKSIEGFINFADCIIE